MNDGGSKLYSFGLPCFKLKKCVLCITIFTYAYVNGELKRTIYLFESSLIAWSLPTIILQSFSLL